MPETLLPCPFCGNDASYFDDFLAEGWMSAVACNECPAVTMTGWDLPDRKRALIDAWNRRTNRTED